MNNVIIYHRNCMDGISAAAITQKAIPDSITISAQYNEGIPDEMYENRNENKDIKPHIGNLYIVDFSFDVETLNKLSMYFNKVYVIDHHKTAIEALTKTKDLTLSVKLYLDENHSGAMLAWIFFNLDKKRHPEHSLRIIKYIQDRDLWRWELPSSKEINTAIRNRIRNSTNSVKEMSELIFSDTPIDFHDLISEGTNIENYKEGLISRIIYNSTTIKIGGHIVPVIGMPGELASETGNMLLNKHPNAPFAATFFISLNTNKVIFSLRSENHREDVSKIAKQYGGGGHRNASGFTIDLYQAKTMRAAEKSGRLILAKYKYEE